MENPASEIPRNETRQNYLERKSVFVLAQLVLMAVMLHGSYRSGFYETDDRNFIGPILKDSWKEFIWRYTVPTVVVSFRIDYLLFGTFSPPPESANVISNNPDDSLNDSFLWVQDSLAPPMRIMNAVYQIIAGLLLWQFLRRLKAGAGIAFLVALLWTVHPMNCENVCWVVERKSVLCAMFGFGSLLASTSTRWWRLPLLNLLFTLAFLSKGSALGLLPLFLSLEIFVPPRQPFTFSSIDWRKLVLTVSIPMLISAVMIVLNIGTFKHEIVGPPGGTVWTALLTDVEIFSRYIHHTLFPFRLTFFNSVEPVVSFTDPRLWLYGIAGTSLLAAMVYFTRPEQRYLTILGVIWFFAALGPHSNLMAIPFWLQDRYVVLAIPGLLLAFFLSARGLALRLSVKAPLLERAALAYLTLFAILLAYRAGFYSSYEHLVLDAAKYQPGSAQARLSAAEVFWQHSQKYALNGSAPNPKLYNVCLQSQYFHVAGALQCSDLENFRGLFDTKIAAVELLGQLGMHAEVVKALQGWLPPPNMKRLDPDALTEAKKKGFSRAFFRTGYLPQTLSRAWALCAEAHLQMGSQKNVPEDDQLALLEQAIKDSDQSLAVNAGQSGLLVKARAQFQIAEINAARGNVYTAQNIFKEALQVLRGVPKESIWYSMAQNLLSNVRPPRIPKIYIY